MLLKYELKKKFVVFLKTFLFYYINNIYKIIYFNFFSFLFSSSSFSQKYYIYYLFFFL